MKYWQFVFSLLIGFLLMRSSASAQQKKLPGFTISKSRTYHMRLVIQVNAPRGALQKAIATGPIPIDWPEQQVKLISERKTPGTITREVKTTGQATMLVCQFPNIPVKGSGIVERIYELTRSQLVFDLPTEKLDRPKKLTGLPKIHMGGAPGVEVFDRRLKKLHQELARPQATGGKQARIFYDWIRKNIKFQEGNFRGARQTYEKRIGDCEDLTALFVALCRIDGIPARTVWIEGHAYAEFYLEDQTQRGYWIPAELTAADWFGKSAQYDPILQKGDKFYDAIARRNVRYVPQSARAFGGAAQLQVLRVPIKMAP